MLIGLISKLVRSISLMRIFVWAMAMVACVFGYTVFEHRSEIFMETSFSPRPIGNMVNETFNVSDITKQEFAEYAASDKSIAGIAIISADLRQNLRTAVFFYGNGNTAKYNQQGRLLPIDQLPLFTSDDENNRQMVKLINGEFFCVPYSSTIMAHASDEPHNELVAVCRASLPPYFGHFSGFISVLLTIDPDLEKQSELKNRLESLATQVYFRDVLPTMHKRRL